MCVYKDIRVEWVQVYFERDLKIYIYLLYIYIAN